MKISDILGNRRMCHFSCSYIWRHLWSTEPLDSNMEPLNWTHPLIVKLIDNFYSFNLTPFLPFFKKERKLSCSWEWQVWFFVLFFFVWQIKISFLMVGHTQEDIDQMFSCISRHLRKNNAQTLVELTRRPSFSMNLSLSYTPVIEVGMYDVRRWLEECTIPNLSGHIHQHQFKLVKGPDRKALLFYKKWLTSPAWQPAQRLHIVNGIPKGFQSLLPRTRVTWSSPRWLRTFRNTTFISTATQSGGGRDLSKLKVWRNLNLNGYFPCWGPATTTTRSWGRMRSQDQRRIVELGWNGGMGGRDVSHYDLLPPRHLYTSHIPLFTISWFKSLSSQANAQTINDEGDSLKDNFIGNGFPRESSVSFSSSKVLKHNYL